MKTIKVRPLAEPVTARVAIPGSKSYTNRALLLGALSPQPVTIKNPLVSDDTHAMIACLRALGMRCTFREDSESGETSIEVGGDIGKIKDKEYTLDTFLSGTTARFILAFAAVVPGTKVVRGRGRLNERPIAHLVEALRQLGAKIQYVDKQGYPPVKVISSSLTPGKVVMKGTISSQFLSALLMVAPLVGEVEIEVDGEQLSKPYIDMTIEGMRQFGVEIENEEYRHYRVRGGQAYRTTDYAVEGDLSSASYFWAIAALTSSTITTTNTNPHSLQADLRFLDILESMGNIVHRGENEITVTGGHVKAVGVDMRDCPDQALTLAVLVAFAPGRTIIRGVRSLRVKETERVVAVEAELAKMDIKTESTEDTLTVYGGAPKSARINTYGDHRMAMSFAVAATKLPGVEINDPDVVAKTFPRFWKSLALMGCPFGTVYEKPNIVLIGMRGGGKTTTAKLLSKKLGKELVELDQLLEEREGATIAELVRQYGWGYFRDRELELVEEVSEWHDLIISTGGGVITRPENMAALKKNGLVMFLSSPADVLTERIDKNDETVRPQLTDAGSTSEEVELVLAERKKLYEAAADETINDTGMTFDEKVEEVMRRLERRRIL